MLELYDNRVFELENIPFSTLKDKIFTKINKSDEEISFFDTQGREYVLLHLQDCCEEVYIDDICGDLDDLIGSEILVAEEVSSTSEEGVYPHETWTFYKLDTIKGGVTIKFYGTSNGYYSEEVSLCLLNQ